MPKTRTSKIKDIEELAYKACDWIWQVENGEMEQDMANTLFKGATVVVNAARVKAQYNHSMGIKAGIAFLEATDAKMIENK